MYRLMLADDSNATQKIVTLAFKDTNYQVICLSDGVDVLEYISHSPVDIMLIDVDLPGIDGYQLSEMLQRDKFTADIPVVIMGSIRCPVDEDKIQGFQPSARLEKPFETSQLLEVVQRLLSDKNNQGFIVRAEKGKACVQKTLSDAVISSICPDIQPDSGPMIDGLNLDQLQAGTRVMSRKYLGQDEPVEKVSERSLSENEYSMVVDLVLEKLSDTLKSVVPEAADEVMKKNRQDN